MDHEQMKKTYTPKRFELEKHDHATQPNTTEVLIVGKVTSGNEFDFADAIESIIVEKKNVLLNFSRCDFINSAALGIMLNCFKEAERRNLSFSLTGLNGEMNTMLEITKLNNVFKIV